MGLPLAVICAEDDLVPVEPLPWPPWPEPWPPPVLGFPVDAPFDEEPPCPPELFEPPEPPPPPGAVDACPCASWEPLVGSDLCAFFVLPGTVIVGGASSYWTPAESSA